MERNSLMVSLFFRLLYTCPYAPCYFQQLPSLLTCKHSSLCVARCFLYRPRHPNQHSSTCLQRMVASKLLLIISSAAYVQPLPTRPISHARRPTWNETPPLPHHDYRIDAHFPLLYCAHSLRLPPKLPPLEPARPHPFPRLSSLLRPHHSTFNQSSHHSIEACPVGTLL